MFPYTQVVRHIKTFIRMVRVFFQVTTTFLGLMAWMTREYFKECYYQLKEASQKGVTKSIIEDRRKNDLSEFIGALSVYEQSILMLRYQAGYDFSEIAADMKVSLPEVIKIHNNAILKIREHRKVEQTKEFAKT